MGSIPTWGLVTPVYQTIFGSPHGNCVSAVIASILDLPISTLPNFIEEHDKQSRSLVGVVEDFLSSRGLKLIRVEFAEDSPLDRAYVGYNEYVVLCGLSPRSTSGKKMYHAVVGKTKGYGFDIVHDPHPDNTGLVGVPDSVWWIVKK